MNKNLRVYHYPQVGYDIVFTIEVKNEDEAYIVIQALALQHLMLFKEGLINDYSNVLGVEMFEDGEWVDYMDEEGREWSEIEEEIEEKRNK